MSGDASVTSCKLFLRSVYDILQFVLSSTRWAAFLLFFGLLDSFQLQIQGVGVQMPYQILLAVPYVLTIMALLVRQKRSGEPLALGEPYFRE